MKVHKRYNKSLIDEILRNKTLNGFFNSNDLGLGRFANHFIRDLASSFIASKNNTKFTYGPYKDKILRLGIDLFHGNKTYIESISLNDNTFFQYISQDIKLEKNFSLYDSYCQTKDFANYIYKYLREEQIKNNIIQHNMYKERFNNNNDIFIHIRLGDVSQIQLSNHNFEYFDDILQNLQFDKAYISSDTIENDICQRLIKKYNLEVFNRDEIETIMFGSTCKNIILSAGTFSWMIGIFGFFSEVYYKLCKNKWSVGYSNEIYDISYWNKID